MKFISLSFSWRSRKYPPLSDIVSQDEIGIPQRFTQVVQHKAEDPIMETRQHSRFLYIRAVIA